MPSIDDIRRSLRKRVVEPIAAPDPGSVWAYEWADERINQKVFAADVRARLVRTALIGCRFPGVTHLAGEDSSIGDCLFEGAVLANGDGLNFINVTFQGPVRYAGTRIVFQGCHFEDSGPEPLDGIGSYAGHGNVVSGSVADEPLWQEFEISLHTAHPGIDAARGLNEATYGGYKRLRAKLQRDKPNWTNESELSFAQCTRGQQAISHLVARPVGFDSDDDERIIELERPVSISIGHTFVIEPGALVVTL